MHGLAVLAIATLPFLLSNPDATSSVVSGKVLFFDECGVPNPPKCLPAFVDIRFLIKGTQTQLYCSTDAPVRKVHEEWVFDYVPPRDCTTETVLARAHYSQSLDWEQDPTPVELTFDSLPHSIEIRIIRRKEPTLSVRQHLFAEAKNVFKGNPEMASLLFGESSRGNDLGFAVAAAEFLEQNDAQAMAWPILSDLDAQNLNIDELDRFRLLMRTAAAAKAAKKTSEALAVYRLAQDIYPTNLQPLQYAYTTARTELRAEDAVAFQAKLANAPVELQTSYAEVATRCLAEGSSNYRFGSVQTLAPSAAKW